MSGSTVLAFAVSHAGQTVGRGECYDLAHEALRSGGDRSAPDYGSVGARDDYTWGRPISEGELQPGDIIQFQTHQVRVEVTRRRGSTVLDTSSETATRNHHTVIVAQVHARGRITVYEQNFQGIRSVQRNDLWLDGGTTVNREPQDSGEPIEVTTVVTRTGTWHCYRPQAPAGAFVP